MRKIVLCRVDRIGDLVLTLPLNKVSQAVLPSDEIYWLIDEKLSFLLPVDAQVILVNKDDGLFSLVKKVKEKNFDLSICFHVPWWVAAALFFAGIKKRVGGASQWYSWVFFNKRLRQKRSQALKNEAYYNLDLFNFALELNVKTLEPFELKPNAELKSKWKNILGEGFIVIHAGMGGSARNWPAKNYKELCEGLLKKGQKVVATGSFIDEGFISKTGILDVKGVVSLINKTPPLELVAVLSLAKAVVAPSTGVAHLSAALGVKTIGLYSPVRVQAPLRWGPLGKNVKVFTPDVDCPGKLNCLGEACSKFDCMKTIDVETILESV